MCWKREETCRCGDCKPSRALLECSSNLPWLEKRPPALETTQKSMQAAGDLGDQLTKKVFTRSEALKELANVADKLKEQINELGKDPALKRMEQAARASNGNDSQTASGLQKQIESLAFNVLINVAPSGLG